MGYLLLQKVIQDNITIKTTKNIHKILYKTNHSTLTGIPIRLHDITINDSFNQYSITINDNNSIEIMNTIDSYLMNVLSIRPILRNNMIILKKNDKINSLIKNYSTTLDINIHMVKNVAYQTSPIVYIL